MELPHILYNMGVETVIEHPYPTNEAEYLAKVRPLHGATLPQWVAVAAALAEEEAKARAQAVKAEAQRRIILRTGASDLQSCITKQLNAQMRALELTRKQVSGSTLSSGELAEAAALQALADDIKALRACSNTLETMSPIPADFADDAHWEID